MKNVSIRVPSWISAGIGLIAFGCNLEILGVFEGSVNVSGDNAVGLILTALGLVALNYRRAVLANIFRPFGLCVILEEDKDENDVIEIKEVDNLDTHIDTNGGEDEGEDEERRKQTCAFTVSSSTFPN